MSAQLSYGDAICLYLNTPKYSFFLSTKNTSSGYILAAKKFNLVETNESIKFYIQPGKSNSRFDGCGQNNKVKSGDIIRLEISTQSNPNQPSYLGYNYSSGLVAERTPILYKSAFETPASTSLKPNVSGYIFKIFKINPTVNTISEGDSIILVGYYKNNSMIATFYLGAKEDVNDKNQADLIFASSMTQINPAGFPAKYSWFVSTIIANAYISDALVNDNKPIVNKDNSDLTADTPSTSELSNVTLNSNKQVPLRYGDGFVLKHKTYGFYASTNGGISYNPCFGTSTLSNATKFVIMPYRVQTDNKIFVWGDGLGGSLLSQSIKSGDIIVFSDYNGNYAGFEKNYSQSTPTVSSASPPYYAVNSNSDGASRIFKYGGSIGDNILTGDDVYVVHLWGWSNGDKSPAFLGSSNLSWTTNKEMFWYYLSSGFPPSFATNYLWNFDQYQPAAYLGITNYSTNHLFSNNSGWYAGLSPYFVSGGAKYTNPTRLQI